MISREQWLLLILTSLIEKETPNLMKIGMRFGKVVSTTSPLNLTRILLTSSSKFSLLEDYNKLSGVIFRMI